MNKPNLQTIKEALQKAWSAETSSTDEWSAVNPSLGQCTVSACIVQDYLGGDIVNSVATLTDGKKVSHYLNLIDGRYIDLTIQQFADGTTFSSPKPKKKSFSSTREYCLSHEDTNNRYEVLKTKVTDIFIRIPIVDLNDKIITYKDRTEIDYNIDIFRTASLWITNSNRDVLLAQRKYDKKVDPGKWAEAVGGTVENDDTYLDTIVREAEEELGLKGIDIKIGPKQLITTPCKYFVQWYTLCIDKPISEFKFQEEEVEQIAWVSTSQLADELRANPDKYIEALPKILELLSTDKP
jgi:isopentenyldiphosphate isomerase